MNPKNKIRQKNESYTGFGEKHYQKFDFVKKFDFSSFAE